MQLKEKQQKSSEDDELDYNKTVPVLIPTDNKNISLTMDVK